jgi:hypothetical protein
MTENLRVVTSLFFCEFSLYLKQRPAHPAYLRERDLASLVSELNQGRRNLDPTIVYLPLHGISSINCRQELSYRTNLDEFNYKGLHRVLLKIFWPCVSFSGLKLLCHHL